MPNIESEIIEESKNQKKNETTCNCTIITSCPVEGKCLSRRVIYKATVSYNNKEQYYFGNCKKL